MNIQPFGRRIYIKPEEQKTVIQSPDQKLIARGEVVAVGDLCKTSVGDHLLFTTWGVDKVEIDGESYYFLIESDEFILAKI